MRTLADRTQAFLADAWRSTRFKGGAFPGDVRRIVDPAFADLRRKLRTARRFTLDDDFVREAAREASVQPKQILRRAALAMLPFDNVWIEFSQRARVAEQVRLGTSARVYNPETIPVTGAFLFWRNFSDAGFWETASFGDANDAPGEAAISPVSYRFNSQGIIPPPGAYVESDSRRRAAKDAMLRAWGYVPESIKPADIDALLRFGYAAPARSWAQPMIDKAGERGDAAFEYFMDSASEERGDLRFMITVLAMLACVPTRHVVQPGGGRFTRRMKSMEYLDSSTVTIHAGRARVARILDSAARKAAAEDHRRAHEVRGHWRNLEYGHKACAHLPVESDGKHALCGKCGHRLVFIDHHQRGDASIGFVRQEYEVTT